MSDTSNTRGAKARLASVGDTIAAPTRTLLGGMRLTAKFAVIGTVLIAPLLFVVQRYASAQNADKAFSAEELSGMDFVDPAFDLQTALDVARGAAVNGQPVDAEGLNTAIDAVTAADARVGGTIGTTETWSTLKNDIQALAEASNDDPEAAFAAWTETTNQLVALISAAADGSNLTLDPDLDSFYLMDAATTKTPALLAAVGLIDDIAVLDPATHGDEIVIANVRIDDAYGAIEAGFAKTIAATDDSSVKSEVETAAAALKEAYDHREEAGGYGRLRDATINTADVAARGLRTLVGNRVDGIVSARNLTLYVSVAAIVMALWLFAGFYQSITRGIRAILGALKLAATGDLTSRANVDTKEEIGDMSRALDQALDGVATAIGAVSARTSQVVGNASMLTDVGGSLQADSARAVFHADSVADLARDLRGDSERTLAEVSSVKDVLGEVTFATEQLDSDMQAVSAASAELTAAVRDVAKVADETQRRAAEAVSQVGVAKDVVVSLTAAADEIGGIVELIEDIAEQTNLLALNATVEAARAGEAGRSFAVVAAEVKNLATATTAATERIRDSIAAVQRGSNDAASAISEVVSVIDGISEGQITVAAAVEEEMAMADEIGRSVSRSAAGIRDITASVGAINQSLDGVKAATENVAATAHKAASAGAEMASTARSNVAAATQTGASAQELNGTAAALQSAVSRFVLSPSTKSNGHQNGPSNSKNNRAKDDVLATAGSPS
ncbi:MAG: methyl-accepting chemotaxis protein [Acidimicrobiales bacterium]